MSWVLLDYHPQVRDGSYPLYWLRKSLTPGPLLICYMGMKIIPTSWTETGSNEILCFAGFLVVVPEVYSPSRNKN